MLVHSSNNDQVSLRSSEMWHQRTGWIVPCVL